MFEPEELMARIVDLEEQLKVSEMAPPAAEQLIACLEGEIAKRDARISELEAELCERTEEVEHALADLNNALAELAAIKAHGNYAPASVVWIDAHHVIEGNNPSFIKDVALVSAERTSETQIPLARLTAAPVQQVSVPDERAAFEREDRYIVIKRSDMDRIPNQKVVHSFLGALGELSAHSVRIPQRKFLVIESDWPEYDPAWKLIQDRVQGRPILDAAPAAPAADAWIPVSERLPGDQGHDSEEVLCFLNGHCSLLDNECRQGGGWGIRLGYYDADIGTFRVFGRPESHVTHWMRLPAAPIKIEANRHD